MSNVKLWIRNAGVIAMIISLKIYCWNIGMESLTKAKRIGLIQLFEECGKEPPEKPKIYILIKFIKGLEDYD